MKNVIGYEDGVLTCFGDTFKVRLRRYSDPFRLHLARNAAIYLGKPDRDNIRRPITILRKRHVPAIFRGEMAEFEFVDVSKEVYDHIITYTTANMRAAGGNRALISNDFTMPSDKMKNPERVRDNIIRSMQAYEDNLEAGETPQVARAAMPTSAKLNTFVYQFNFLTLGESIFKQRVWEKGAQGNTVKVIQAMFELCSYMDKELWDTFYKYYGTPSIEWDLTGDRLEKITMSQFVKMITEKSLDVSNRPVTEVMRELFGEQKTMW